MNPREEMPIGLSFSMSMNEKAMSAYAGMGEEEKRKVIEAAKQVSSKKEMQNLVSRLGNGERFS
mgnify:CR=1 FL=1